MVTEEDIHRYHMAERVYGLVPILNPSVGNAGQSSKGKKTQETDPERVRIVLSISPPSSSPPPPVAHMNRTGEGSIAHPNTNGMNMEAGQGVPKETKSKKRKSNVQDAVEDQGDNVEQAVMESKKDKEDKKDKKDKKNKEDKKVKKDKKDKKEKKDKAITAQHKARASIPSPAIASTSTITPLEPEGPKRKKEKKSKSTQINEAESSTPKVKKQNKSNPPLPKATNSTPGMGGPDELSSDEADIFEIDELLPSSPVLPSPPPLPSTSQNQIISQPTPTPKPRKKRVSDSSGFDTPSAPDHLRYPHPHPLSNSTGGESTPSRLGRIGGTPIKKALVRLGASWVTSTPVPK